MRYLISSRATSVSFGEYDAATPADALRAMYADAGEAYPGDERAISLWSAEDPSRTLLSEIVRDSGLSIAAFARLVVGRDERTVRRWLAGEIEIPRQAGEWLERVRLEPSPTEIVIRVSVQPPA